MDYNHTHGVVCLISWFWTVFICLVLVILAVQATTFRLSGRYRFKQLKRLIPSVDEQVRLFREDLNLSLDLEFMEFDIVDRNSKKNRPIRSKGYPFNTSKIKNEDHTDRFLVREPKPS